MATANMQATQRYLTRKGYGFEPVQGGLRITSCPEKGNRLGIGFWTWGDLYARVFKCSGCGKQVLTAAEVLGGYQCPLCTVTAEG